MKKYLLTLLSSLTLSTIALAHGEIEVGPNGGRILEFSKDQSMHGEVVLQGDKFHIALLDKDMKPVAIGEQTLVATGGATGKPQKLAVEKTGDKFVLPVVKNGEWLILQFKQNAQSKAITARFQYDTAACPTCKNAEWLCKCAEKGEKKK
jgi:hypothetical protein